MNLPGMFLIQSVNIASVMTDETAFQQPESSLAECEQHSFPLAAAIQNINTRHRAGSSMAAPVQNMGSSFNATSFQKKTRSKLISIPGTRPSVQNGQLIVSTGVTSLDYLIGQCFINSLLS